MKYGLEPRVKKFDNFWLFMKILFRTSGGRNPKRELGFGHIYRCVNLCKELSSHEILFLIEDYGTVSSILKENNLKFSKLKPGINENGFSVAK